MGRGCSCWTVCAACSIHWKTTTSVEPSANRETTKNLPNGRGLGHDFSLLFSFYFVLSRSMRIYLLACSSVLLLTNSIQSNSDSYSHSHCNPLTHADTQLFVHYPPLSNPNPNSNFQFLISHCLLSTIIHSLTHSLFNCLKLQAYVPSQVPKSESQFRVSASGTSFQSLRSFRVQFLRV